MAEQEQFDVVIRGSGQGGKLLAGERVFLNLGSHAAVPGIPGLEAARPL
jgi:hypothetical protein